MPSRTTIGIATIIAVAILTIFLNVNLGVWVNSLPIGSAENIDFIAGTNITITGATSTDNTVALTVNSTAPVSTTTIQVDDSTVFATTSPTLDFGPIFDVTQSPNDEANITIDFTEATVVDFGGATSLEIPACGITDADGEICSRETATSTLFVWFQGEQHALSATSSKGLLLFSATTSDDFALWRTQDHIVVTKVCFLAEGGTNVVLSLQEYDSDGNNPSSLMSGDLTAVAGSTGCTGDSGAPTTNENTIEGDNWVGIIVTSISGTNDRLHITWYFKWIL